MRERLEAYAGTYQFYHARREEFADDNTIPFRVSSTPLEITQSQSTEIEHLGHDITQYVSAVDELYHDDPRVKALLDRGKPEIFLADEDPRYLFVRPDLILTPQGFSICEIETSPFGLALADILNHAYRDEGYETLVGSEDLKEHIHATTPLDGTIVYSDKTQAYAGQLHFLADRLFSDEDRNWTAEPSEAVSEDDIATAYRAFYLAEYLTDPTIRTFLDAGTQTNRLFLPGLTPHLEEKAILALIWDTRWQQFFHDKLGTASFQHLRAMIPPTWIVGEEAYFAPGLPENISTSLDLARISRSKRTFVLKSSGFSTNSSWAEGVHFLHEKSATKAQELLQAAYDDPHRLHIVQQFTKAVDTPMHYQNRTTNTTLPMRARIRLTPYFAMDGDKQGNLVAIKATGCENTDYIHASTASINTAVSKAA
ncbi:MAG: hypothetical protein ACEQSA_05340 [Weeksellaceae bacterium]